MIAAILGSLLLAGCGGSGVISAATNAKLDAAYATTISAYIADPLWETRDAYDAAHDLLIPLTHAFQNGEEARIQAFAEFYARFLNDGQATLVQGGKLTETQWTYVLGRFIALAAQYGLTDRLPAGLVDYACSQLRRFWLDDPAWQWDRAPFANMRDRIAWKMGSGPFKFGYYKGIIDEDYFCLGLGADLAGYLRIAAPNDERRKLADEVCAVFEQVVEVRGEFLPNGGWLFDKGTWHEHPVFHFAGSSRLEKGQPKALVPDISEDSAHHMRWAALLHSLEMGFEPGHPARTLARRALAGLEHQFLDFVVTPPSDEFPGYRATNYIDGRNGLYRWDNDTAVGYGPHGLSYTLTEGWWPLFGTSRTRDFYKALAGRAPFNPQVVELYRNPLVVRTRHPLVNDTAPLINDFRWVQLELGSRLRSESPP
ncbi:MAG: hypothetical protein HONBIEJF_02035 [Fimbriimonadaceae bacterium]|nr:hypothetical protein [Fimbriimonadaceae bacterium]